MWSNKNVNKTKFKGEWTLEVKAADFLMLTVTLSDSI